jgi:hypothetical protein
MILADAAAIGRTDAKSSFWRDVVRRSEQQQKPDGEDHLRRRLLQRAKPIAEYRALLRTHGLSMTEPTEVVDDEQLSQLANEPQRRLENNNNNKNNQNAQYDYDANYEMFSFSGFSLKYAKCQPVQYFSQNALAAGMRSPMLLQDVVILRLCPYKACTSSRQFGCHYNYAEYAISLPDYVQIMMGYYSTKTQYACTYCEDCIRTANGGRRLDDAQAAADEGDGAQQEQEGNQQNQNANNQQQQACDEDLFATYCSDYYNMCGVDDPNANNANADGEEAEAATVYYDYDTASNFMQCAQVNYNDYAYFVRPYCDAKNGTIAMDVYFDDFCGESASEEIDIANLNLGFDDGIFQTMYKTGCIDCSSQDQAPLNNANSVLCNIIHLDSAKCTNDLSYDLFDGEYSTYDSSREAECAFIEGLRFGAYDENGLMASSNSVSGWTYAPSTSQKVMLGLSIVMCVGFVVYACYLHHAMTNLLIKSLSHRELLPPSRHRSHSKNNRSQRGRSVSASKKGGDWNESA